MQSAQKIEGKVPVPLPNIGTNKRRVYDVYKTAGRPLTVSEARALLPDIHPHSVTTAVDYLKKDGWLIEAGKGEKGGGRAPDRYRFVDDPKPPAKTRKPVTHTRAIDIGVQLFEHDYIPKVAKKFIAGNPVTGERAVRKLIDDLRKLFRDDNVVEFPRNPTPVPAPVRPIKRTQRKVEPTTVTPPGTKDLAWKSEDAGRGRTRYIARAPVGHYAIEPVESVDFSGSSDEGPPPHQHDVRYRPTNNYVDDTWLGTMRTVDKAKAAAQRHYITKFK